MLGHYDVGVDAGLMTRTGFLELVLDDEFRFGIGEEWKAAVAAEGDEVKGFGLLISFEAVRHGMSVVGESVRAAVLVDTVA